MGKRIKMILMGVIVGLIGVMLIRFATVEFEGVTYYRYRSTLNGNSILPLFHLVFIIFPFIQTIRYSISMLKVYDVENYGFYFWFSYSVSAIVFSIIT